MTDEVRQEDIEIAAAYLSAQAFGCSKLDMIALLTARAEDGNQHALPYLFAAHVSPLRHRIAVLEGALRQIADDPYQHGQRIQAMKKLARATLNGEKKDG